MPGRMVSACCAKPFIGAGFRVVSFDPKICSRMAWKEWPGSTSMKRASSETVTAGDAGSSTERGFDSVPVRPSMSGREGLSHPRTWSKERFSITITTTVLIGPENLCFFPTLTETRRKRRKRDMDTRRRPISGERS